MPEKTHVHILGLGLPARSPEGLSYPALRHPVLQAAEVVIAGSEQMEVFDKACPGHPARRLIVCAACLEDIYLEIEHNRAGGIRQVALASGDPLYFGFGASLIRRLGRENIITLPGLSSMQAAFALCGIPWEEAQHVSLHGRKDWTPLAHAALSGKPVCILTDKDSPPSQVARYLAERGHLRFTLHCLEELYLDARSGEIKAESRTSLPLGEALTQKEPGGGQAVIVLEPPVTRIKNSFGNADSDFEHENRLITKSPVRAAALHSLGIEPEDTVWDLGAGCGSVGLEASRLAYRGQVRCVEKEAPRAEHILENRKRLNAFNLDVTVASLPHWLDEDAKLLPRPKRVFLGGGLGGKKAASENKENVGHALRLDGDAAESGRACESEASPCEAGELIAKIWKLLLPGGRLVASCVLLSSLEAARAALARLGAGVSISQIQAAQSRPLAGDLRLEAENPVFLVIASKPEGTDNGRK